MSLYGNWKYRHRRNKTVHYNARCRKTMASHCHLPARVSTKQFQFAGYTQTGIAHRWMPPLCVRPYAFLTNHAAINASSSSRVFNNNHVRRANDARYHCGYAAFSREKARPTHIYYIRTRTPGATFTQDRVLPIYLISAKCIRSLALTLQPPAWLYRTIDRPHPILGSAYSDTHTRPYAETRTYHKHPS